jgi:uncharacterized LabA/DUF88 family protein
MKINNPSQYGKTKYLFIDGGYLRERLKDFNDELKELFGEKGEIDYNLLRGDHQRVFYYDCLPERREGEDKRKYEAKLQKVKIFFERLQCLSGFHIYQGVVKGQRQKRIDVLISVHMLEHSINHNMQELTFIAGDEDFVPLIESINRLGIYTNLLYDSRSVSNELIYAVDNSDEIDIYKIYSWQRKGFKDKHPFN